MWLAHHYPDEYDRCVVIGRSHVCRRCLVLYPLMIVVMVLTSGLQLGTTVDALVVIALPLPAVVEVVLELVGVLRYDARRQIALTVLLAIGLGRGFALYLQDHLSVLFWGVVVAYAIVVVVALGVRYWRGTRSADVT